MVDLPLRIEKAVYGGDGLVRTGAEQTKAVPFTLPGELVRYDVDASSGEAMLRVLEPSAARTEPQCVHFGQCGGCQYQMAAYPAQVELKQSILTEILIGEGLGKMPPVQAWPSPDPWGYRNRVRFRAHTTEGNVQLGYNTRETNAFLPVRMCPIAAPILWQAAAALMQVAGESGRGTAWLHAAHSIEVSCDENAGKVQVHLLCTGKTPRDPGSFQALATALRSRLPALISMAASRLHIASGRPKERLALWGAGGLVYQVGEDSFWLTPGNFFQVNRYLVPTMLEIACGARQGRLAWDLYAGIGLFSRRLSRQFEAVTAVEANPAAMQELQRGLPEKGDEALEMSTLAYLERSALQRERPELIVLDPPRAGVGEDVCKLLLALRPACLVYISCDPTTLARDLRILTAEVYRVKEAHMIDLFPQTYHLETVMVLERRDVQAEGS